MITITVRHKVVDFAKWKSVFDPRRRRDAARRARSPAASTRGTARRTTCTVMLDWDTLERAQAFLASAPLMSGMSEAGVREMPQITILERRDEYALI